MQSIIDLIRMCSGKNAKLSIQRTVVGRNSTNGTVEVNGNKLFYKWADAKLIVAEKRGYASIRRRFPVPKLNACIVREQYGLLLYEYEKGFDQESFWLAGWIQNSPADTEEYDRVFGRIASVVRDTATSTLKLKRKTAPLDSTTRARVIPGGRFWQLYGDRGERLPSDLRKQPLVNGQHFNFDILSSMRELSFKATSDEVTVCALTHGDFAPHNIGIKPIFVDLANAGWNPIAGDLACGFWEIYSGGYLSPKYAPFVYARYPHLQWPDTSVIVDIDRLVGSDNCLHFKVCLPERRQRVLKVWEREVLQPIIMAGLDRFPSWDWRHEFMEYLSIKLVSTYDLKTFDPIDVNFILLHFCKFRSKKCTDSARKCAVIPLSKVQRF